MSGTATRIDGTRKQEGPAATALAPPPKLRRRPALIAAAIGAICLGALLAGWAWTATTNTQEVLVARHSIERGAVIEADDLTRLRLSADPALKPVAAEQFDKVVGQRAAVDIAAGGMLTPGSFTTEVVPGEGQSVVGVALTPAQAPGLDLQYGDKVRVVVTPAQGGELPAETPLSNDATVVGVHTSDETGQTVVDLLVPKADVAVLATRIATGNIALVLDSRER
ncbi:SAF domain-containing protein [Nocardioides rubriscoriae]|uniref:SAF domain-containing protein n=1 Tax=Nocardioides rubriscoriae TaxID=642762 RepID=UPI001B87C9CF|nr:SAF domain-containing protein [Nocardioides rubriscoriae]